MAVDTQPQRGSVLRNTLLLVGAQFLGMPLTILLNAVMGRYLGAADFGYLYLATTLTAFGFLFVDWGHAGVLPAAVAQDPSRAPTMLGSSLVWRLGSAVVVTLVVMLVAVFIDYPLRLQPVLVLVSVQALLGSLATAYADTARGLERAEVSALLRIGTQLTAALVVIPTLLWIGGLVPLMIGQVAASAVIVPLVIWRASKVGVGKLSFDVAALKELTKRGWGFMVFTIAMTLQGNVDAISLSKLATPEVIGWNAAAGRLVGTLLVPATALIASLYPTLSRLFVEDKPRFDQTLRRSIHGTSLLAIPLALCCALYRELGVALYSKEGFGPAGQNLLVLAGMVLLLYFSMPLSSALLAAGKQNMWAYAQCASVVLRLILNPLLIPWAQTRYGNGGIGVNLSAVICEMMLVTIAVWLIPGKIMDKELTVGLGKSAVAGVAMVAVGLGLEAVHLTPWVAAPIAVVVYTVVLWMIGGIEKSLLERALSKFQGKFARRNA